MELRFGQLARHSDLEPTALARRFFDGDRAAESLNDEAAA